MKIIPIILSGGSGTRLWPVSRSSNPKQFLKFFGDHSLFQKAVLRLKNSEIFTKPIIVSNQEHRFIVAEELREISVAAQSILLEPSGRNTAPAITIAALDLLSKNDQDSEDVMLVMPSDHIISDEQKFISFVKEGYEAAKQGYLITFGIVPTKPETGYGYIKQAAKLSNFSGNIFTVEKFIEKPSESLAKEFVASQQYFWNSGIFMFKASVYLEAMAKLQNDILQHCQASYNNSIRDLDFIRLQAERFDQCQKISIDYAVMEKSQNIALLPINVGWSDVGSWSAVAEISDKDSAQNTILGDVATIKTNNCYINSQQGLVATIGVSDLIIVSLKDVVLVANKNNAQEVKDLYELLQKQKREECNSHAKVLRPWGSFEVIDCANRFKVKRITVNAGASLSLQMHKHRAEHWVIVKGVATVTCDDQQFTLSEDHSTYIPIGKKHRLENKGTELLEIIEIQTGSYLGEDDIVRFSDVYGRDNSIAK